MARRLPTLSDYDRSGDASPQARQARRALNRPDNREPSTRPERPPLGIDGCWCGGQYGHYWPGKAGGAPHPRTGEAAAQTIAQGFIPGGAGGGPACP
jgi:hypothetical protein